MTLSILFDARLLLSRPTGIGQYICSLVPELLRAAPDITFHLLTPPKMWDGYAVDTWNAPNLTVHRRDWRRMSVQQQWLVPGLARDIQADLIHYPHFDAPVWLSSLPVVATIHDAKYLVRPDFFPRLGIVKRAYMRFAFAATLQRARRVISVSHSTAADLARLFHFPDDRVRVIYEAADPSIVPVPESVQRSFRAAYSLRKPYLLTVGELRPHKNYARLITAYAQSVSQRDFDLVIVGQKHADSPDLVGLTRTLGLEEKVHILTDVDNEGLRAAYAGAELFLFLSLYEGFGLPILEAMKCGVPVVGSRTTATGEVLGEGGIQVDPQDHGKIAATIDEIMHDPVKRQYLVEQGRKRERRFTWQSAAEQTAALYRESLS